MRYLVLFFLCVFLNAEVINKYETDKKIVFGNKNNSFIKKSNIKNSYCSIEHKLECMEKNENNKYQKKDKK